MQVIAINYEIVLDTQIGSLGTKKKSPAGLHYVMPWTEASQFTKEVAVNGSHDITKSIY